MALARTLRDVTNDRRWVETLLITGLITTLTIILTPLIVGLLGWTALLGYQVVLIRRWRHGDRRLPTWDRFSVLLTLGIRAQAGALVYQLPNVVLGGVLLAVSGAFGGGGVVAGTLLTLLSLCLTPILVLYNLISIPAFALALTRFADEERFGVFLEIGVVLVRLRDQFGSTVLYLIGVLVVTGVSIVLALLPIVGWGLLAALIVPVTAALTAEYARVVLPLPVEPKR